MTSVPLQEVLFILGSISGFIFTSSLLVQFHLMTMHMVLNSNKLGEQIGKLESKYKTKGFWNHSPIDQPEHVSFVVVDCFVLFLPSLIPVPQL